MQNTLLNAVGSRGETISDSENLSIGTQTCKQINCTNQNGVSAIRET